MSSTKMDTVTQLFAKSLQISHVPNDSYFSLVYNEHTQEVITNEFIPKGTCIGQIHGDPMYIWDIPHGDYLFVDEDMVLDVSRITPRTMLTLIRDDNQSDHMKNCSIHVEQDDKTFRNCFFLYTTTDIYPGEELVNAIPTYR